MTYEQSDKFHDSVIKEFGPVEPFKPMAYYNPDGDCLEFLISNEPHFAKRIDGWVTVYYSEESGNMIGGFIKGVRHNLLRKFPGLRIDFQGNLAKVTCLLRAPAYQAGDRVKQKVYKDLIDRVAEAEEAEADFVADLVPA